MAAKNQTEVASVKESAQLPAGMDLAEIMKDSGAGVKDMGMDDVAVPYLYILQKGSPQADPDTEKFITGAVPGMFLNSVTEELFDGRENGILVIPCAYERKYVEWIDRDSGGGGYVADHDIDSGILSECTPNEKGIPVLKNGHLVIETAYHYVYMLNTHNGQWEQIIIPMKSTMLKKSRRWNKTLMGTFIPGTTVQAPRWLYVYKLMTVKETKGANTWSNFDIERLDQMVDQEQYLKAKGFAQLFEAGQVQRASELDTGNTIQGEATKPEERSAGQKDLDDADMPF